MYVLERYTLSIDRTPFRMPKYMIRFMQLFKVLSVDCIVNFYQLIEISQTGLF